MKTIGIIGGMSWESSVQYYTIINRAVRDRIGPVAAFKQALVVKRLPKTRSGKILRGTMRSIADGKPWKMPATIEDPVILDEITQALSAIGYPR